jgi:peptidase MA superfamily protein
VAASLKPTAVATPGEAVQRNTAVTTVLAARSKAVLTRDKAAFLALIDPQARAFRARQSVVFDRLKKVPFDNWTYEYASEGPELPAARATALPKGSWVARVFLKYTFRGADLPVGQEQQLTLVPRGGAWLLAGDSDGGGSGKDIWDIGPIKVVKSKSTLVIGAGTASSLRRYATDGDRAVRDVGRVWKHSWSHRPVVIVPRTQHDMGVITGDGGKGLSQIAAVATGYRVVVVNPSAYKRLGDLGRRVIMAHELTHVATEPISHTEVPIWMTEGFADYVAYRAVDLPSGLIAQDILRQVRTKGAPKFLPDDADFDKSRGDLSPAYEGAWLACRMIARTYGEKKLMALYLAFGDRTTTLPEKDIKAVLGITETKLVKDWRSYLKAQAR